LSASTHLPPNDGVLIADRLGGYVAAMGATELRPDVRMKAATCLLDGLALAMAAQAEPTTAAILGSPLLGLSDHGCRVWATGAHAPLSEAVMLNAYAVHARFQDDCDMRSWTHPGSLVIPAAVSVAEATGATLDAALRGIVSGYSVLSWLGAGEKVGRAVVARSFRASPTLGPVAAAAAASTVLGLTADQSANALAISAASAGGVIDTVRSGSSDWRFQNASAAWRGALAAILARQGLDGSRAIFESSKGFLSAFAGIAPPPETESDPDPAMILDVWAKPFPTLGDNVAVAASALALRERTALDPTTISQVRVHQNAEFASYPGTAYRGPYVTPTQAIASTAFAVCAALATGAITYDLYSTALQDPRIMSLIENLSVTPEPGYGYLDGKVVVVTDRGDELSCETSELAREMFYRDPTTAVAAFTSTVREVGVLVDADSFASSLLARVASGDSDVAVTKVLDEAAALQVAGAPR
jgi:2-methylcitrate dehydratase PrpD